MRRRIFKNIGASWLGLATTMVVGFFLMPFVLRHLGDTRFGLWVLMATFTGYYGLLDLGFRNAILRYVARYTAQENRTELNRVASTTFATYSILGLIVLLVSILAAWKLDLIFKIEPQWVSDGQWLLIIFGIGTALGFPLNVFACFLEGLQLYTWIGVIQSVMMVLRAALILFILGHGFGLVALGIVTVSTNLGAAIVFTIIALHHCPVQVSWRYADRAMLKTLASFGLVTFWIGIAALLRFQLDAVVIGAFISVQAITVFSIGSKLVMYATEAVQVMAGVFTPLFSHFDAKEEVDQLQRTLIRANSYSTLVALPLAIILLVSGRNLIRTWVGPNYDQSYTILVILMASTVLYLGQAGSTKVLYGMAKHRFLAVMLLAEGLANLGLSLLLLRFIGIRGVAWGTAIPLAATSVLVLPVYVCRVLKLSVSRYFIHAHLYPALVSVPFLIALFVADRLVSLTGYAGLFVELAPPLLVYGLSALIFLYKFEGLSNRTFLVKRQYSSL